MSAAGKEEQPSIEDILSSIRDLIADGSTAEGEDAGAPVAAQASGSETATINGSHHHHIADAADHHAHHRNSAALEPDDSPARNDGVLDLSEDFIVAHEETEDVHEDSNGTSPGEAMQAGQSEHVGQPEPEDTAGPAQPEPDHETSADPTDEAPVESADLWPQDFQMPVGQSGPTSPFTAASTHPDSAWPANDPFDVTESYKRARSQGMNVRVSRDHTAPEDPPEPQDHHSADAAFSGTGTANESEAIELASFAETAQDDTTAAVDETAASGPAEDDMHKADEINEPGEPDAAQPIPRPFPGTDEIEAAFGLSKLPGTGAPPLSDPHQPDGAEYQASGDAELDDMEDTAEPGQHQGGRGMADEDRNVTPGYAPLSGGHEAVAQDFSEDAVDKRTDDPCVAAPAPAHGAHTMPSQAHKSLEDSVKELLRPMIQDWLDQNMPRLVEAAMREQTASHDGEYGRTEGDRDPQHDREDQDR